MSVTALAVHEAGHVIANIGSGADVVTLHALADCFEVRCYPVLPGGAEGHLRSLMAAAAAEVITQHREFKVSSMADLAELAPIWSVYDLQQVRILQQAGKISEGQLLGVFASVFQSIDQQVILEVAELLQPIIERLADGQAEVVYRAPRMLTH